MDITQNEWQNKEWECFNDPANALFGWCCTPCMICKNAQGLGESTGLYCVLAACCPVPAIFLLRQKTREVYGIEGDTTMDVVCSCCLPACVNCQTASELKHRNPV